MPFVDRWTKIRRKVGGGSSSSQMRSRSYQNKSRQRTKRSLPSTDPGGDERDNSARLSWEQSSASSGTRLSFMKIYKQHGADFVLSQQDAGKKQSDLMDENGFTIHRLNFPEGLLAGRDDEIDQLRSAMKTHNERLEEIAKSIDSKSPTATTGTGPNLQVSTLISIGGFSGTGVSNSREQVNKKCEECMTMKTLNISFPPRSFMKENCISKKAQA